jgi:hypothetical protein
MDELESVRQAAQTMDAIGQQDVTVVASLLAPGFLHRAPGGEARMPRRSSRRFARYPAKSRS